jgi:hypothetical protein
VEEATVSDAVEVVTPVEVVAPDPDARQRELLALDNRLSTEIRQLERITEQARTDADDEIDLLAGDMASADDLGQLLETVMAREREQQAALLTLDLKRRMRLRVRDALLPLRVEMKRRAIVAIDEGIQRSEQQIADIQTRLGELAREGAALQTQRQALADRQERELVDRNRRMPSHARGVKVYVASASPWEPPSDVLVLASAWRAAIEQAIAEQHVVIDVVINEQTGQVTKLTPDRAAAAAAV